MTVDEIIRQIAKQHNTTPELVRREMELALKEARQSSDPIVQARWAAIPHKGKQVTLEEFLNYTAGILNQKS